MRCANCKHSWFQEGPAVKSEPINIQNVEAPPINIAPRSADNPKSNDNNAFDKGQEHGQDIHKPTDSKDSKDSDALAERAMPHSHGVQDDKAVAPAAAAPVAAGAAATPPAPTSAAPIDSVAKAPDNDSDNLFNTMDQNPALSQEHIPVKEQNEYAQALAAPPPAPFDHQPPFKPRRNPAKMWTIAAIIFALLIGIAALATWYSGILDGSLSSTPEAVPLEVSVNVNEMNETSDGRRFFVVSGTIINPTSDTLDVPNMIATLLDEDDREIYNWEIPAPVDTLGPGARIEFSGAARDNVPRAATTVAVDWKIAR